MLLGCGQELGIGTRESWLWLLVPLWAIRNVKSSCSQRSSLPPQSGPLQSRLHIHVLTAVVCDNDAEMWVSSDLGQALHISDELLHPASLVLHYPGRSGKEKTARVKER